MKVSHYTEIPAHKLALAGARGAEIRLLIGAEDGAPGFVMLLLELEPGGNTPEHSHPWEEEIFVKAGEGTLKTKQGERPIRAGDVVFFSPKESHQFVNTGAGALEFICVIPKRD